MTLFEELRDRIEFEVIQLNLPIEEQAITAKAILEEIIAEAIKNKDLDKDEVDILQIQFTTGDLGEGLGKPFFYASNDHTKSTIHKLKDKEKKPK